MNVYEKIGETRIQTLYAGAIEAVVEDTNLMASRHPFRSAQMAERRRMGTQNHINILSSIAPPLASLQSNDRDVYAPFFWLFCFCLAAC